MRTEIGVDEPDEPDESYDYERFGRWYVPRASAFIDSQHQIIAMAAEGLSVEEMAERLGTLPQLVQRRIESIRRVAEVSSTSRALPIPWRPPETD